MGGAGPVCIGLVGLTGTAATGPTGSPPIPTLKLCSNSWPEPSLMERMIECCVPAAVAARGLEAVVHEGKEERQQK